MSEDRSRRLSQIFDPLARFTDHSGAGNSASTPNSPRLLPRRSRDPPPPPPRPIAHPSRLDPLEYELAAADIDPVNWQERCLELQLELHRSRNQATRVRDMLRDKVVCVINITVITRTLHAYSSYSNSTTEPPTGRIVVNSLRLIIHIPDLALTIMFIYGAHTKNYKLFRIYYFSIVINTIIMFVFRIATNIWSVIRYEMGLRFSLYWMTFSTTISLICVGMQVYMILMVRSEMIKLGENCTFRFFNFGAEAECKLNTNKDGASSGRVRDHEVEINL